MENTAFVDKADDLMQNGKHWIAAHRLKVESENPLTDKGPWKRVVAHEQFYTLPHHRKKQGIIRDALHSGGDYVKEERMEYCGLPNKEDGVWFCRVRSCPICQYRRNLKWIARTFKTVDQIVDSKPNANYGLLTLTVKNCDVSNLADEINKLHKAFVKLFSYKAVKSQVIGYARATEVTRKFDGTAHPHLHVFVMAKPGFFSGKQYISQKKWSEMWQKALNVDYAPIVDCKWFQEKDIGSRKLQIIGSLKYLTKEADNCTLDFAWFSEMAKQTAGFKFIALGGEIKKSFQISSNPSTINSSQLGGKTAMAERQEQLPKDTALDAGSNNFENPRKPKKFKRK